ncbi:LysM peptidoglycan-binding domain-containing protein [Bacteroidales bacterium OttesenSCG-928-A17]|nr:LysM peptidoglycan-binding domain-containing protein [Bacteroidales bacterium OttesenSCG-928-A17]
MRRLLLLSALIFLFSGGYAQDNLPEELIDNSEELLNDSSEIADAEPLIIKADTLYIPEAWDANLDSLLNSWHIKNYTVSSEHEGYVCQEPVCDSIYVDRLSKLPCIIELPYNDVVRSCIDLYVDRRRDLVQYMLGLQALYFPMIEETLDAYGLPLELKCLPIIESALNPVALSRAGASGLWQFMLPTGKFYGLEINSLVDERRDPHKATDAACRFLKDLHGIYQDWNLAIAAYNCGAGNVNKAIRRAGGKRDYWEIYPYLPKETRMYVPLFIAANYVMNYYPYHQLYPVETVLPLSTDTVMVTDLIHFDQIAEVLQIDKEQIQALNPQYKMEIIPGNSKARALKLPVMQTYSFIENLDSIKNHRAEELFANRTYVGKSAPNKEKTIHKVKNGENLTTIGNKYGVTAAEIRKWNGLKSNRVAAGRNLTVYIDNGGYATTKTTSKSTSKNSSATASTSSKSQTNDGSGYANYKVRSGESYYTIAKKYPGYSHNDLMKINNVSSPTLRVGQVIKVPRI